MPIGKHIFVFVLSMFVRINVGVYAKLSKCWWGTWSGKVWEPLL